MSKAAELIAGLQSNADFDSDGGFTLDREKAREKMRQFQLADPHRYVLLLVEALALRGATKIVFDIDSDDMHLRADAALEWADLDELYASLFVDRTSVAIRARRELALACNAVMALNPRHCKIESVGVDAQTGERYGIAATLRSEVEDELSRFEPSAEAQLEPYTSIHVKERFRPGLMVRFVHNMQGVLPEELLITSRCAQASIEITLDGRRVSAGLPADLVAGVRFEGEGIVGVAGLVSDAERRRRSVMVLLSNGVEIATHELSESVGGLWFWIDCSRLRKDVSQADVVRNDPAYQAILASVGRARDRVLGRLVELWADGSYFTDETQPSSANIYDLLRACFLRWADPSWLAPNAGPLGRLAQIPLWRMIAGEPMSAVGLLEALGPKGAVTYSTEPHDEVLPKGWSPVILVTGGELELEAIARVYPEATDATARLAREVPWELSRRAWRARPYAVAFDSDRIGHVTFEHGEIRGALFITAGGCSDVRIVVDGCLLTELELDLGLGEATLSAVVSGSLAATSDYSRPQRTRAYAAVLLALLAAVPRALEQIAAARPRLVKGVLTALTREHFAREWLETFGFTARYAPQLLERLGAPELLPPLGLHAQTPDNAVARAVRMRRVDGVELDLMQIELERRTRQQQGGQVLWVDRGAVPQTSREVARSRLHVDAHELRLLRAIFGSASLRDESSAYQLEQQRQEFMARPTRALPELQTTWTTRIELSLGDAGRISGAVGLDTDQLRYWKPDTPRRMNIELHMLERRLCTLQLSSWLPGVEAVLSWDEAPVNANYDGLAKGGESSLQRAVELGLVQLLLERAEAARTQRPSDGERRLLWMGLVTPFVCAELYAAYRAICRFYAERQAEAAEAYFELMTLYPGIPLDELRAAITLLLQEHKLPSRESVVALTGREGPRQGGRQFHRQLLTHYPVLDQAALVATISGGSLSLDALARSFDSEQTIAYVEDENVRWDSSERVIIRSNRIDQVALIRLFGKDVFEEVSGWIHEQVHQRAFEARAQLEQLRVPEHQRLVGVEFVRDGFRGELAVPDWSAGEGGSMKLTFCHDRRVVQALELHGALPVIGLVDDPEAELNADFSAVDIGSRRVAQLRSLLNDILLEQLLPRLAAGYAAFDGRQQSFARSWIFAHWQRKSPRAGQHPNRLDDAGRAFAALPLFRDTDGEARSLDELIARAEQLGTLWYVERHPGVSVEPPFAVVEARAEFLDILERLFPKLEDFGPRWQQRVLGQRRKAEAAQLPVAQAPADAVHHAKLERNGLVGQLWLPPRRPFEGAVALGSEGKIVEFISPLPLLPVLGVVSGELLTDDAFESVKFTTSQRMYLRAKVIKVYSSLLEDHRQDLARPERPNFMEPEVVAIRQQRFAHSRAAAVALAQARLRGESFDAILGNLVRRLETEALLRMSSGRSISVDLARQVRPIEFAHLGIWDPDLPPVDPSERARLLLGEPLEPAKRERDKAEDKAEAEAEAEAELESEPEPADERAAKLTDPHDEGAALNEGEAALAAMMGFGPGASLAAMDEVGDSAAFIEAIASDFFETETETETETAGSEPIDIGGLITEMQEQHTMTVDPIQVLLERIRAELRLLREAHEVVLAEGMLDKVQAEARGGKMLVIIDDGVLFDATHPRFVRALEDPDPIWVSFLASTAYTALNTWLEAITDEHEIMFHDAHARLLLSAMLEA